MPKAAVKALPKRNQVKLADTWDLTKVFRTDAAWERGFRKLENLAEGYTAFRGTLGQSAKQIRAYYDFDAEVDLLAGFVGLYAHLKQAENVADGTYQGMTARYRHLGTRISESASFVAPELRAIPKKKMDGFLSDPVLEPYRFLLEKLLRYRPHILSEKEERLLAMQGEVAGTASRIFSQLTDADFKFGYIKNEHGEQVELSHGSYRTLLESPKRAVRKQAFEQYYSVYEAHANSLAATLSSSTLQDVYRSRVRNFPSAREAALFGDRVPATVYDRLIDAVRANLPVLHRYLEIRKRAMRIKDIHVYDTYVPLVDEGRTKIPYGDAADTICRALEPLGAPYTKTLYDGLTKLRWVDRYENQGKRSGAFSSGVYKSPPYILMNYREDVIDSMFTLAHEAGHSMHSYFSNKHQPIQYADYTIFVAEVASTFNEQLLNHYLLERAASDQERLRLVCREIDEIRGTIVRQTMFAEFEKIIHARAEAGEPLTLEQFRADYRGLLDAYFGPNFAIDDALSLECFRIPHFYSAFYVYKYATGLSAAIALSQAVLNGGKKERDRYLTILKSGGSKYPLDVLRDAGVDLEQPDAVDAAMRRLAVLVGQLDDLV